jgi:hypothetical protein
MVMRISPVIIFSLIFLSNNCFACHMLEEDKKPVITQKTTKLCVPYQYSLEDLPNELINQITVYLSPLDILTFPI